MQPIPLPETVEAESPVKSRPFTCSPTSNPLSPICSQPLPCKEPCSPVSCTSPVRTQPVPAVTSTPLANPVSEEGAPEPRKQPDSPAETPTKRADIIEEFWMKSAEIRKSLGLTPLERSRAPERSLTVPTPDSSSSPRSYTPEDLSEELRPPFTGRTVIRRLNITVEGQVISPVDKEPKSSGSEKRDLSSSSGLGLNGSVATSQTVASESFNNSDSAMLTPPSSPPPPVPKQDSVKQKKSQVAWNNEAAPAKAATPTTPVAATPAPPSSTTPEPKTSPPPVSVTTTTTTTAVVMRESSRPRREEVRKSFIECVEEIPFADDVEDTYDDRTPDNSLHDRFFTPPTSRVPRERPPLHLALAMENGKPKISGVKVSAGSQGISAFSPEAKDVAEERIRAREKSIKSQALKDAMAKQLSKMKEPEAQTKSGSHRVAWNVTEPAAGKGKSPPSSVSPKTSAVKALESRKQAEAEKVLTPQGSRSLEVSAASSESSTGGKVKKRSSLFSPRKSKKEKKAKGEARASDKRGSEDVPKHKSLWKVVFSGYKKDKKKKAEDKSLPSTPSSSTTTDSGKRRASPLGRSSGKTRAGTPNSLPKSS